MIVWILLIVVLAFAGKLIYDVQKNKRKINQLNESAKIEADKIREWQTIAGIKQHNKESAPFNPLNNKLNENVIDELRNDFQHSNFPPESESINVLTAKVTTIKTQFKSDNDPLASIQMSRVSKEGKEKMAEIAKEDISRQIEENIERFAVSPIELDVPNKPKRKYNKKPKQ